MPPYFIALLALVLIGLLCLFAVAGKVMRADPKEETKTAVIVGLAAGILAVTTAFASEVGNPAAIIAAGMWAAHQGPKFLRKKEDDKK